MPDSSSHQPSTIGPESVTVLGFDYGAKRIGVAVGNALTGARALDVIGNGDRGPDWQRIEALLREWRPGALLIGLPLTMDGEEQANSRAARAFAAALEQRFGLRTDLVDERLSSHAAASRFAARRASGQARRKHAQALDAVAAEIIIETWLTQLPRQYPDPDRT
ncbi:MAG TPA: Holliday junction resolvase RuvX [Rudaea sp.]|nr:Holliday junction resolvase RuvX [Rudaea sp.]